MKIKFVARGNYSTPRQNKNKQTAFHGKSCDFYVFGGNYNFNMAEDNDKAEIATVKHPIFNLCSQMSGFCYDSAREIAVRDIHF